MGGRKTLTRGSANPFRGGSKILWDTLTEVVEDAEVVLSDGVSSPVGRCQKPTSRLRNVDRHAVAPVIEGSKIGLPDSIAVLSRRGVEVEGFSWIAGNAESALIERSEVILRERIATIGSGPVVGGSFGEILRNAVTVFEEIAEKEFGVGVIMSCASAKAIEGNGVVDGGGVLLQEILTEAVDGGGITGIGLGAKPGDWSGSSGGGPLCVRKSNERTSGEKEEKGERDEL